MKFYKKYDIPFRDFITGDAMKDIHDGMITMLLEKELSDSEREIYTEVIDYVEKLYPHEASNS